MADDIEFQIKRATDALRQAAEDLATIAGLPAPQCIHIDHFGADLRDLEDLAMRQGAKLHTGGSLAWVEVYTAGEAHQQSAVQFTTFLRN